MESSITEQLSLLVLQLGVLLFASQTVGNLFAKMRIPSVLGELATGILLGPYLLGRIGFPFCPAGLFPMPAAGAALPVSTPLYALATLGSIVLLFQSGLETDFRTFFRYSLAGTLVGLGGVVVSFAFGELLGHFIYHCGMLDPRALFLGILSTATSVGISARILSERRAIDSPEGTTILAAAVIDDVLGIICLAVVMGLVQGEGNGAVGVSWRKIGLVALKSVGIWVGFTAVGLMSAHFFARFLKRFHSKTTYAVLSLGAAMLLAGIMEKCGLAMIIGAYTAGLSLSRSDLAFTIQLRLHGIYGFLVPVFFVVMGMMVDVRVLADWDTLKFGLLFSLFAVLGKVLGCMLPALFLNFNRRGALRIGCGMIPRGEVALIIAGIGATTGMVLSDGQVVPIVDTRLFGIAIIMTLLTTLVAPPLLMAALNLPGRGVRKVKPDALSIHLEYPMPSRVVTDFLVRKLIVDFRQEGFRHSDYSKDYSVVNFRKERTSFVMFVNENDISFECAKADAPAIKNIYNETTYELYQNLEELRRLSLTETVAKDADVYENVVPFDENNLTLEEVIPANCAIVDLQASDYRGVMEELVRHLFRCGYVSDFGECMQDILSREALASTVMEGGIAMPHAKSSTVRRMVSVVALFREGVSVTVEDKILRLVILTVAPKEEDSPYMQYIAHQASRLCRPESLDAVCRSRNAAELRRFFLD